MKIIAIIGTYRKGMVIDTAVDVLLASAAENGANVEKVYLTDSMIKFCRNCRNCVAADPDLRRGECVIDDDMTAILEKIEQADAIVLASPVNFGSVTAITQRFIERLISLTTWRLDGKIRAPRNRIKEKNKKAVIITASTMPSLMGRILCPRVFGVMKDAAGLLGAKVVDKLWLGLIAPAIEESIADKHKQLAHEAGKRLAQS